MNGLPVTVRLLDPPLHEFLPHDDGGTESDGEGVGRQAKSRDRQASQRSARS